MIAKRIKAKPRTRGRGTARAAQVRALLDYMATPDKESAYREYLLNYILEGGSGRENVERLQHLGANNFVSTTFAGQRAEMMAVAEQAVRSPNPLDHWLISWKEHEHPTNAQVDAAAAMFVQELGLAGHQYLFAVHGDTHNIHVHLAVNRYDPVSDRTVSVNKGFDREAGARAVARIVDHFGWEPEKNARYHVVDGEVEFTATGRERRDGSNTALRVEAAAYETRTGHRSAQRIAMEDAVPEILVAKSWQEMHARLAVKGLSYTPAGSNGAVIIVDGVAIKSSYVRRQITPGALQKRFERPFQPRAPEVVLQPRDTHRDVLDHSFRADEHRRALQAQRNGGRERRRGRAGQKKQLVAAHRREAADEVSAVSVLDWRGRENERDIIVEAMRRERKAAEKLIVLPQQKTVPTDLETWLKDEKEVWFAERWRHRLDPPPPAGTFVGQLRSACPQQEIDGYHPHPIPGGTRYARPGQGTAFVDWGERVEVVPKMGDEATLAALRLAVTKFERVKVEGTEAFQTAVHRLAIEHGLVDRLDPTFVARQAPKDTGRVTPKKAAVSPASGVPGPPVGRKTLLEFAAAAVASSSRTSERRSSAIGLGARRPQDVQEGTREPTAASTSPPPPSRMPISHAIGPKTVGRSDATQPVERPTSIAKGPKRNEPPPQVPPGKGPER